MRVLSILVCVLFVGGTTGQAADRRPRSIVGAIRWDAWHGDAGLDFHRKRSDGKREVLTPGMAVERSLGPKHWHYRLPFYAKIVGENQVEVRANSQPVMDREIAYASRAGLDYWAFLTYHPDSPMSLGLKLYLSSKHKSKIRFCMIVHHVRLEERKVEIARLVGYMRDPQYATVLGGRPLVYVLRCQGGAKLLNEWGEGHYIAPHRQYGFGYLDAVRDVFTDEPKPHTDLVPEDVGLGPYDSLYRKTLEAQVRSSR